MSTPADPTQVKSIVDRLKRVQSSFGPAGLPKPAENRDVTNTDYPLARTQPRDPGWRRSKMITGSGGGPELHTLNL